MSTISKVAKKFGLSRSTLLYYDSIGLLSPKNRSQSRYRHYSEADLERLKRICQYRETGLSLKEISRIVSSDSNQVHAALEQRLNDLNREISNLRDQQSVILRILKKRNLLKKSRVMDKDMWSALLRSAGLDDQAMKRWHVEFERLSPENHQDFLESLSLSKPEIASIRKWSRSKKP